jgi:YVTN family beta-propeller protein
MTQVLGLLALSAILALVAIPRRQTVGADDPAPEKDPSPIALALSADGSRLLAANQGNGTVALIDTKAGTVLSAIPTGDRPSGVAISRDGHRAVVAHWYGYDAAILDVGDDTLKVVGRVDVGPEPRGVAISPDGKTAFFAVGVSNEVVRVDLESRTVNGRLAVGREPRGLAIAPNGSRLLVGNARGRSLSVISVGSWAVEKTIPIDGDNLRQVAISADGTTGYVANMKNRGMATTTRFIDLGWVLGQRVTKVSMADGEDYETLSLDPEGKASADVHGVGISGDGEYLAVSSGGTHEVLLFREGSRPLPWRENGARDLIPPELLKKDGRFRRVQVGGRPTEIAFAPDGRTLYVANYLGNSVQVVDADAAELVKTIPLGGPSEPSLTRQGEALFHDATRSFNQWYSCNTCHSDGHTNGLDFDTMNDGWQDTSLTHKRSRKKVPTLRGVTKTGPWTWHGWQESLDDAVVESYTKSMQGKRPSPEEVRAVVAFLRSLEFPRNPYREADGSMSESARRGEAVFRSPKAACSSCHGGPEFTDGKLHDVGLGERGDVYKTHNPPSLRGVYDKDPYLHDGRARTLRDVLTEGHNPEDVMGLGMLTEGDLDDLIAYLKSL